MRYNKIALSQGNYYYPSISQFNPEYSTTTSVPGLKMRNGLLYNSAMDLDYINLYLPETHHFFNLGLLLYTMHRTGLGAPLDFRIKIKQSKEFMQQIGDRIT